MKQNKTWIKHLNKLSPTQYLKFLDSVGDELNSSNTRMTEKVDGSAIRMGVDDKGFYMESANVGPIRDAGGFSDYCLSRHNEVFRHAEGFDRLFELFKDSDFVEQNLEPNKGKMVGEIMWWDFSEYTKQKIKFSKLWYDFKYFQEPKTLVILQHENFEFNPWMKENYFSDDLTVMGAELDFESIDITKRKEFLYTGLNLLIQCAHDLDGLKFEDIYALLRSRSQKAKRYRKLSESQIKMSQDDLFISIFRSVKNFHFGEVTEGIVIETKEHTLKIIHPMFTEAMEADKIQPLKTPTNENNSLYLREV